MVLNFESDWNSHEGTLKNVKHAIIFEYLNIILELEDIIVQPIEHILFQ